MDIYLQIRWVSKPIGALEILQSITRWLDEYSCPVIPRRRQDRVWVLTRPSASWDRLSHSARLSREALWFAWLESESDDLLKIMQRRVSIHEILTWRSPSRIILGSGFWPEFLDGLSANHIFTHVLTNPEEFSTFLVRQNWWSLGYGPLYFLLEFQSCSPQLMGNQLTFMTFSRSEFLSQSLLTQQLSLMSTHFRKRPCWAMTCRGRNYIGHHKDTPQIFDRICTWLSYTCADKESWLYDR